MCGPKNVTTTTRTEIDPILKSYLYGTSMPASQKALFGYTGSGGMKDGGLVSLAKKKKGYATGGLVVDDLQPGTLDWFRAIDMGVIDADGNPTTPNTTGTTTPPNTPVDPTQANPAPPPLRNPSYLSEVTPYVSEANPEGQGIVPLAYTLATQSELNLPNYAIAPRNLMQRTTSPMAWNMRGNWQQPLDTSYDWYNQAMDMYGQAGEAAGAAAGMGFDYLDQGGAAMGDAYDRLMRVSGNAYNRSRFNTAPVRDAARESGAIGDASLDFVKPVATSLGQAGETSGAFGERSARGLRALGQQAGNYGLDAAGGISAAGAYGAPATETSVGALMAGARGIQNLPAATRRGFQASLAHLDPALSRSTAAGYRSARSGMDYAADAKSALTGSGQMFDPRRITPFMNHYENAAVDQAMKDIRRQGDVAMNQVRADAVGQGAFGGSRTAIAEQELNRNVLEQQGRTAADMRNTGYRDAAQRSQSAFEDAMRRRQSGASTYGQLGIAGAGLGMQAAQQHAANAKTLTDAGLSAVTGAANTQLGTAAQQAANYGQAAGLSQGQGQIGLSAANQAGNMGLAGYGQRIGAAGTAAQTGLAGYGQQMSGYNQAGNMGLAGYGQQMSGQQARGNLSLGAAGQTGAATGQQISGYGTAGGLGQGLGSLGVSYGGLGNSTAGQFTGIGQGMTGTASAQVGAAGQGQGMGVQDINTFLNVGGAAQAQNQSMLDARRMSQWQQAMIPYQQLAYASDIAQGAPTGITSMMSSPGPSPASQIMGLGMGIYGLNQAGVKMPWNWGGG